MRVSYAIIFVSDMKRSLMFYRDMLGLPLRFDHRVGPSSPPREQHWRCT
jgi:catechol 2,3-dioxygenase-like lactoylglutathione lyase family enzyme